MNITQHGVINLSERWGEEAKNQGVTKPIWFHAWVVNPPQLRTSPVCLITLAKYAFAFNAFFSISSAPLTSLFLSSMAFLNLSRRSQDANRNTLRVSFDIRLACMSAYASLL